MRVTGLLAVVILSGCELTGGGGGTGGGTGGIDFLKGYVFVRKDDRNVYLADDRNLQKALGPLTTSGGTRHPSLSRDGKRVVFSRLVGADTELATVPTSGGTPTVVLGSSPLVKDLRNPVFSKDGTKIYFSYDHGSSSSIGVVNVDGTEFKSLAGTASLSYGAPSLFADGLTLLAGAGNNPGALTQLERIDLATGMPTNLTTNLGTLEGQAVVNRVVISPDGTRAAYDGRVTSQSTRIFVINLATRVVTKLTDYTMDANDSFPCWVGNDKVGFSSDSGGNDSVYALSAASMSTSGGLAVGGATEPWYGP